ncbi:AAA family ATPase [Priestia endophytica]
MSFRKKVKKNTPKVELQSITTLVAGGYKTGKTRLWKEVTELHYTTPEDALLIAFEDGYETWELDNIVPVHEEGTDKTLWKVWEFFKKTVAPELVQEAKDGRVTKLIGVDTADRAIDACTAWVLYDRSKKYGKTFVSLQEISESTDENGWVALYEELKKPFDTLKNAGYGFVHICWTKEKETTLHNGLKYNSIQLQMSATGKKVFESQASLICCLHNEVTVFDKKGATLEDNVTDKKGREKASNFHETKTMMYFRPSEYVEIAGGRYTNLPDKVEYSAENFLEVFKNAVEGQLKKTTKTVSELKVEEEQQREEKLKETSDKLENDPAELFAKVEEVVGNMSREQKLKASAEFEKVFGVGNYKQEAGNAENLKKALKIVTEITGN